MSSNVKDGRGGNRLPAIVTARRHTINFGMFFGGKGLNSESEVEVDGLGRKVGCSILREWQGVMNVYHWVPLDVDRGRKFFMV